jgi:hypothetical protein
VGLGVTGKSFFVYAQKFSAGLCIFPLQSSALLFCHTQVGYLGFNSLDRISLKEYLFFHSPLIEFTFVETK